MSSIKLAIIGAGAMGSAIATGLTESQETTDKSFKAEEIILYDVDSEKLKQLNMNYGFRTCESIFDLFKDKSSRDQIEQLIIAVKPKDMDKLLQSLSSLNLAESCTIISIAAGVNISVMEKHFPNHPIIRAMPNTPCQIQKGATVLSPNLKVTNSQLNKALEIFKSLGVALVLDESKLDAVTALSGSGPAYIFLLAEAMTEAGIKLGLDEHSASSLTKATIYGAGALLFESGVEASELRKKVTSPGGTTEAALNSFKSNNFSNIVEQALQAASNKAASL